MTHVKAILYKRVMMRRLLNTRNFAHLCALLINYAFGLFTRYTCLCTSSDLKSPEGLTLLLLSWLYIHIYSFIAFMLLISTGLNTPVPSSQNTTAPFTLYPRCTTDDRWKLPGDPNAGSYVPACQLALLSLTSQQIYEPAAMPRRFLAARAGGHFIGLLVWTPQRYIYQCKTQSNVVVEKGASFHMCVNRQSKVMYCCGCHAKRLRPLCHYFITRTADRTVYEDICG